MSPVVLDGLDREPALRSFRRRVYQGRSARKRRVGEHVATHEVLWLVGHVTGFWERRGSNDGGSVSILQSPVDKLEVSLVVLSPDVLRAGGKNGTV